MKNADSMIKSIVKRLDTNNDGKIQYEGESHLRSWWLMVLFGEFSVPS